MRLLLLILFVAIVGGIAAAAVKRARRRDQVPEINQHPERLEQSLDETDDA